METHRKIIKKRWIKGEGGGSWGSSVQISFRLGGPRSMKVAILFLETPPRLNV